MNKNALKKVSVRKVVTDTAKLPDSVGFPGNMQGITRQLTKAEIKAQKDLRNLNKRF